MRKIIIGMSIFGGLSYGLFSCNTTKQQLKEASVAQDESIWTPEQILTQLFQYKTFQGRADVNFKDGNMDQNLVLNLKIQHEKELWASAIAMGIAEVARVSLTPEKLEGIVRLNKTAYSLPLTDLKEWVGTTISFQQIEDLLIGNPLLRSGAPTNLKQDKDLTLFDVLEGDFKQTVTFHQPSKQIQRIQITHASSDFKADIHLEDYVALGLNQYFAKYKLILVQAEGKSYQLSMRFRNHDLDLPVETPFQIPNSYKVQSLLKL